MEPGLILPTASAQAETQNLPYDKHGCVDWKALALRQLRSYSTEDLEAELKRRLRAAFKCSECRCPAGCACCEPGKCWCSDSPLNTQGPFGV